MAAIKRASANNVTNPGVGTYAYNDKPSNWNNNIPANTPGKKNNAAIPDIKTLIQAGIDPKTGLPLKFLGSLDEGFKKSNVALLTVIDEQDAINRYKWYNLPYGVNQELLERILYYKGQLAFFYMEDTASFYVLPYALDGTIDVYGRYISITPLPFNGTAAVPESRKPRAWIPGYKLKVQYDILLDGPKIGDTDSCVLLWDYSPGIAQTIMSRAALNAPLLDVMADCIPFMRTALLSATGINGMRVSTQDDYTNVEAASRSMDRAALTGRKYIPIVGQVEYQELTSGQVAKSEEFLLAMQGLDNYRLSTYGISNGGLFQKKAHMLQAEQDQSGISSSPLEDGLRLRQHFCDIVNSIWGLGIWVEVNDKVTRQSTEAPDDSQNDGGEREEGKNNVQSVE